MIHWRSQLNAGLLPCLLFRPVGLAALCAAVGVVVVVHFGAAGSEALALFALATAAALFGQWAGGWRGGCVGGVGGVGGESR